MRPQILMRSRGRGERLPAYTEKRALVVPRTLSSERQLLQLCRTEARTDFFEEFGSLPVVAIPESRFRSSIRRRRRFIPVPDGPWISNTRNP